MKVTAAFDAFSFTRYGTVSGEVGDPSTGSGRTKEDVVRNEGD